MTRIQQLPLAAAVILCVPLSGHSQQEAAVVFSEGSRVRLTVDQESNRLTGILDRIASDTLWVVSGDPASVSAYPLETIEALEVVTGSKPSVWQGALIGAGVGLATGLILDAAAGCKEPGCNEPWEDPTFAIAAFCSASGAALGALLGLTVRTDRWQEVPLEDLHVEPMISQGTGLRGITLGLRLRI